MQNGEKHSLEKTKKVIKMLFRRRESVKVFIEIAKQIENPLIYER